ncbi:MAG: transporter substrate-binding domain-containing protein [Firmicutes bacterium]|nr:transporter substrate-binding domain-containing protein [Bacillota bacterium]
MHKKIILTILTLILTMSILGCSKDNKTSASSQELQPITIGVMPDVDSIPFIIANHNGYFKDEGLDVEIMHFKSALDRDSALQAGNLDGAISDMLAVVFFNDSKFNVKITSKTNGSFKLIAGKNSNISKLEEINNKSIGISKNTIIEYLTDRIINTSNINISLDKVSIPKIPTRLEMLKNGKIDLATLPEPLASVAVANGSKILNSSDKLGINPSIMLFTEDAISSKKREIKTLYKAYNKAIKYLKKEPLENYVQVLINDAGFPESIKNTLILPDYNKASMPSKKEFNEVLDWLKSKDLTTSTYSFNELCDESFIK